MLATRTNRKLHNTPEMVKGVPGEGVPGFLARSRNKCPPVDERWRAALMEPERERWRERSRSTELNSGQREYADRRYKAIGRRLATRIDQCGTRGKMVACACPNSSRFRSFGCRQWWLCAECRKQRQPRLGRRIREGLAARFAEASEAWPDTYEGRPRLVLVTLTVRHSGDLAEDRAAIARGWRRFYQRLHRRVGAWSYAGVWEVTPSDGGHVHAHVACVWPWMPWGEQQQTERMPWNVRQLWLDSCPESERISFVADRKDEKASTPASVANYLGKYIAKGCDTGWFTPELRAEIAATMYGKRSVFTSVRFWEKFTPLCPCCKSPWKIAKHIYDSPAMPVFWDAVPDWERQLEEPMGQLPLDIVDTEPW